MDLGLFTFLARFWACFLVLNRKLATLKGSFRLAISQPLQFGQKRYINRDEITFYQTFYGEAGFA